MIVVLAADHGGANLKNELAAVLRDKGYKILDLGTNDAEVSVDYPVYAKEAASLVAEGKADRGIVCCGSGIGVSIASNRVRGVRCALCVDENMAELSRRHNDANMLALGGRLLDVEKAKRIMESWLETKFEGGRHKRRIDMIDGI